MQQDFLLAALCPVNDTLVFFCLISDTARKKTPAVTKAIEDLGEQPLAPWDNLYQLSNSRDGYFFWVSFTNIENQTIQTQKGNPNVLERLRPARLIPLPETTGEHQQGCNVLSSLIILQQRCEAVFSPSKCFQIMLFSCHSNFSGMQYLKLLWTFFYKWLTTKKRSLLTKLPGTNLQRSSSDIAISICITITHFHDA